MFKNKPRMSEPDINELASKIESLDHQLDNLYEQITYSRTEVQYLLEIYQNHVIFPQHCESLKNTDNFIQHLGLRNLKHPHNSKKDGVFFIYHLEKLKRQFMSNSEIEKYKSDLTKNLMIKEDSDFIIPFNLNGGINK